MLCFANDTAVLILLTTITSCKKKKAVESSFPEIVNQLTSYKLVGRLESNFPSGMKESNITVTLLRTRRKLKDFLSKEGFDI